MGKNRDNPDKYLLTTHHKVGRCNELRANVNEETNKMLLDLFTHRAFNTVFKENQEPQKQL